MAELSDRIKPKVPKRGEKRKDNPRDRRVAEQEVFEQETFEQEGYEEHVNGNRKMTHCGSRNRRLSYKACSSKWHLAQAHDYLQYAQSQVYSAIPRVHKFCLNYTVISSY